MHHSPDLSSSDYHLIPKLKEASPWTEILTDDELSNVTEEWLKEQSG